MTETGIIEIGLQRQGHRDRIIETMTPETRIIETRTYRLGT